MFQEYGRYCISPYSLKINPQIEIASGHMHIPSCNAAKFHNSLIDSLGGVADKESLYMKDMVKKKFPHKVPQLK